MHDKNKPGAVEAGELEVAAVVLGTTLLAVRTVPSSDREQHPQMLINEAGLYKERSLAGMMTTSDKI